MPVMETFFNERRIPYHIAFAFENNKLLCWGINHPGIHAEIAVLNKLKFLQTKRLIKWNKINMFVVRHKVDSDGNVCFAFSKPCTHCGEHIRRAQIGIICWSNTNETFEYCKACDFASSHVSKMGRSDIRSTSNIKRQQK